MERRYSVPPPTNSSPGAEPVHPHQPLGPRPHPIVGPPVGPSASEDLHAWSIYRQNLNSDFTDSALGSSEKSPLPYGNFQLRESTVQSILSHPRYGPKSALGSNMYTYLKFGLPRVFPPSRGPRDGSSGYDSSDDGSPYLHQHGRSYLRSRSDPDFRNQSLHKPYSGHGPWPGPPPGGGRPEDWRTRSSSEANLLSHEAHLRHQVHRRSVQELQSIPYEVEHQVVPTRHSISKAGSHTSLPVSRRGIHRDPAAVSSRLGPVSEADMIPREVYYTAVPDHMENSSFSKYPHLQVRGLEVDSSSSQQVLLSGISFEVHGGEILAIMATSEDEGTALLDVLSGRSSNIGKVHGDILLNGQSVRSHQLRTRVAYVQSDNHLCPDLTVLQTLGFHHWLRRASTHGLSNNVAKLAIKDRIHALIEDLGLDQVRYTKVASLTTSEKCRLNVACQLLLDTEIVVLDQPTRGMDIFDTFFLVEFLRQWAGNGGTGGVSGGRIVILTLHPPTYEIFTMLSRVVLLSAGRLMFSGRRRDMLPYFAMVEYPCPAYKNPSDYYLDLVTLDDLSAEAMLESSQRIEQLADLFRRKQEPLSDPGPPIALPGKIQQANCFTQAFVLLLRGLVYAQPLSLIRWCTQLLLAAIMSVIIGAIFFDLPTSDPQFLLGDRLGFHYAVTCVALWPTLLLLSLSEVRRERWPVFRDIRNRLYGSIVYIITKFLYSLPGSVCVWLAYLVPAYLMSGLQDQSNDSYTPYFYIGYMLLLLLAMQTLLTAVGLAFRSLHLAAILAGLLVTALSLASGFPVHISDLGVWCRWLGAVSPVRLLTPLVLQNEYRPEALQNSAITSVCHNRKVQHQEIIVQLPCPPPPNGTAALLYAGLLPDSRQPVYAPPLTVGVFWFVCFLVAVGSFVACRHRPRIPRNNPNKP